MPLPLAILASVGIFGAFFAIACVIAGARSDAARDRDWAAFSGRPTRGSGAASKRHHLLGSSKSFHGDTDHNR